MAGGSEDLVSSFRLAVTDEARLFGGGLLALVVYALWVGVSGAALTFAADALNVGLSPQPWTGAKTGLAAVALVAWVLVPAAVAAALLVGQLTNESGNIAQRYRYRHPATLLAPPAVVLVVAVAATVALAGPPWPVFVVLAFAALFLLVRTVAYGYRVFSLSLPRALATAAGLSFLALSAALLTGGAVIAGRRDYLVDVTDGLTGSLGIDGAVWLVDEAVTVAGVTLPAAVAVAVAVPAGLSALYLFVQTVAGVFNWARKPDIPRSELRTGQRYPDFARPTTTPMGATGGSGSGPSAAPAASGASTGSGAGSASASGAGSVSGPGSGSGSAASSANGSAASTSSSGSPDSSSDPSPDPADSADPAGGRAGSGADGSPTVDTGPADPQMTDEVSNTRVYTPPDDGDGGDGGDDPLSSGADPGNGGREERTGADGQKGNPTGSSAAGTGEAADAAGGDVCPECDGSHDPGAVFCPACGAALE